MTGISLISRARAQEASLTTMILKRACLAGMVATLTLGGHAFATQVNYECSGGTRLTARFSPPGVPKGCLTLTFGTGRKLTLPQVMSAGGGRYANGDIEFWIKGRNATLILGGARETCSTR